jgi:hypothetical protein
MMRKSWNGSAHHEVVVGVEAGVEVEATQPPGPQQHRDDELDVRTGSVVPGVDDHLGALAGRDAVRVRRTPVGHVGHVERGLEQLVLQQHALVPAEPVVRLA